MCCHRNIGRPVRLFTHFVSPRQSWSVNEYGGIESLYNSNSNSPAITRNDHVLVQVKAVSVNPIDLLMIEGYGKSLFPQLTRLASVNSIFPRNEFPLVPGRDFSGVVLAVGQACDKYTVGDQVWGSVGVFTRQGTLSPVLRIRETELSFRPMCITHVEAASLPFVANTLVASLRRVRYSEASTCLVLGASGGVGSFAVQYLKSVLPQSVVVGTCRAHALNFVKSLNADHVVNSSEDDLPERINSVAGSGFDLVVNLLPNDDLVGQISCSSNARVISTSCSVIHKIDSNGFSTVVEGFFDILAREWAGNRKYGFFRSDPEVLDEVRSLVETDQIKPVVDSVFGLKDVPEAYRRLKGGGVKGKVVIQMQ